MNRKEFIINTLTTVGGLSLAANAACVPIPKRKVNGKILNSYYFRAHMYTLVPRHVREDMKWMADAGTDVVSVAILEQDLYAAVENIAIICNEAAKAGMEVWGVPSRWAGLLAGAPKVPSQFTIQNHETWKKNKDGSYASSDVSGRISSIFHPTTKEFMQATAIKMFETWDLKGLIWDEPKTLGPDYHELAIAQLGPDAPLEKYIDANVDFYSIINQSIKSAFPEHKIGLFIYANYSDEIVEKCATIKNLDLYGCDGRPWRNEDGGQQESNGKVLLGGVGQRFIDAARKNSKQSLWLIENHNMSHADIPILEKRLPEVIEADVDHLIYYYFPRNLSDPDKIMGIIRNNMVKYNK